jgi:hypothetical protein
MREKRMEFAIFEHRAHVNLFDGYLRFRVENESNYRPQIVGFSKWPDSLHCEPP